MFDSLALGLPGSFRVGHWQVPVFGVFVAVGVVGALWLSQRTAKLASVDELKLWDAGMFAVLAAFVASRVLLIAENWGAFLRFPVMVLALPSLTYGGMALTAALVIAYLRWKKIPLLAAMDAWAPCACVLVVCVALGHFFEGTDAGMPTSLPWGVHALGDTVLGKTHPVQLYAVAAWLWLLWVLLRKIARRTVFRRRSGDVAGLGMFYAGFIAFLLGMLQQPNETYGGVWMDPTQWFALGMIVCGAWLTFSRPPITLSRIEAAIILENFVSGRGRAVDHEAIEYGTFTDPLLKEIRHKVFFGKLTDEQEQKMLAYAKQLREHASESTLTRDQVAELLEGWANDFSDRELKHELIEYGKFTDPILMELKDRWPDLWESTDRAEQKELFLDYAKRLRADKKRKQEEMA